MIYNPLNSYEKSIKKPLPGISATLKERFKGFLIDLWLMLFFVVVFKGISPIVILFYFAMSWKINEQSIGQSIMALKIRTKTGPIGFFLAFFRTILMFFSPFLH